MKLPLIYKKIEENKVNLEFMSTGFTKLDDQLDGGFMKKELIVIGGNTGIGKSYFAGQLLHNIALQGFKCAYFSLEISNEMVVSRLIGQQANVKSTHVVTGKYGLGDQGSIEKVKDGLSHYEEFLHFYDDIYLFPAISEEIKKQQFEFIVIDFIQNVVMMNMDEYSRLSYVALELQKLAKQTNSTILVLSQLSNMVARDKNTSIIEYKGSGSIATVADLGFFIQRGDIDINPDDLKLYLRKNRRGVSGLVFDFVFTRPGGLLYEQTHV